MPVIKSFRLGHENKNNQSSKTGKPSHFKSSYSKRGSPAHRENLTKSRFMQRKKHLPFNHHIRFPNSPEGTLVTSNSHILTPTVTIPNLSASSLTMSVLAQSASPEVLTPPVHHTISDLPGSTTRTHIPLSPIV